MIDLIEKHKLDLNTITNDEIKIVISDFINLSPELVYKLAKKSYDDTSSVSVEAMKKMLVIELQKAFISFINNKYDKKILVPYLLSCANVMAKDNKNENYKSFYICPGCKYFNKLEFVDVKTKLCYCNSCKSSLEDCLDEKAIKLYTTFSIHSKKGFRCPDCKRFIPESLDKKEIISCPYYDCSFYGNVSNLNSMHHPKVRTNINNVELSFLDSTSITIGNEFKKESYKDRLSDTIDNSLSSSESSVLVKEDIEYNLSILNSTIDSQMNSLHYNSSNATVLHKTLMYQAYKNIIKKYPDEMISYLVYLHRNGGMQHKIFQEYVSLLENNLPFSFKKNGKTCNVTSLLDENLCIFSGITNFKSKINIKNEIPNDTEEIYVGSRKGSYCNPYYIGKLIDVVDLDNNKSILDKVKQYSFFKIDMMSDVVTGTNVIVTHLKIPPHYQMGGMVYLNRIRRKIVDKVYHTIHGKKRELRR